MTYSPKFRGDTAAGASRGVDSGYTNGSGGTLSKGSVVSINGAGNILVIDVSDETSVKRLVGLVKEDLANLATGQVANTGRLEDVSGFNVGDALYVSSAGGLTTTQPSIGVGGFSSGDFVIFVGVVVKNEFDALKKDIQLFLTVVGQL
jgi:hypothetical protein